MAATTFPQLHVGCAGWSLPRDSWPHFPDAVGGTHLQRYAQRLGAVEINSSFYRRHQNATYARWAASVPADFRFAVKLPKTITHEQRLRHGEPLLESFLAQVAGLGEKLGCLLVQLPPSLAFDESVAAPFFRVLRGQHGGPVALEPRHASWFAPELDAALKEWRIARVLADPVLHEAGTSPGGWRGLVYVHLHGSPRMYYSAYGQPVLDRLANRLMLESAVADTVWCIFDNTASGAATENALYLSCAVRNAHEKGN